MQQDDTNAKDLAQRLIGLLTSTGFPNATSIDAIALDEHLHAALQQSTPATEQFLKWILDNTSAATNWPAYERPDLRQTLLAYGDDNEQDSDDDLSSVDREYESLQAQRSQFLHTLRNLEEELDQLQFQESEAVDVARKLSSETGDLSVRMDTMLSTIDETAQKIFQHPTDSTSSTSNAYSSAATSQYLFQCHEQIAKIQRLDEQFLGEVERMINDRLDRDPFRNVREAFQLHEEEGGMVAGSDALLHDDTQSATAIGGEGTASIFHLLLESDSTMDQEVIELCKLYRSTKMNHIRTMAKLKGLEQEVQALQEINTRLMEAVVHQEKQELQQQQHGSEGSSNSASTDSARASTLQTIAGAKVAASQQMRQNEIALISAQREASRLMEELDQTLSAPLPVSSSQAIGGAGAGGPLSSSLGSTLPIGGDETMMGDISNMTEICDRIARSDIELRFLEARYQDYIRSQKIHVSELDKAIDALLDLYGCSQTVSLILHQEQNSIQQAKDTLGSLNMCLGRIPAAPPVSALATTNIIATTIAKSPTVEHEAGTVQEQRALTDLHVEYTRAYQRRAELTQQAWDLANAIHENVVGLSRVHEALDRRLLYRFSATNDLSSSSRPMLASRQLGEAQDVLSIKADELREQLERATEIVHEQINRQRTL